MQLARIYDISVSEDLDPEIMALLNSAFQKLGIKARIAPQANDVIIGTEKGFLTIDILRKDRFYNEIISGRMEDRERLASGVYIVLLTPPPQQMKERETRVVEGKKLSLASRGISVIEVDDPGKVGELVAELVNRFRKVKVYPKIVKPRVRKTLSDVQIAVLATIPGVGEERARRLLSAFGSVANVAKARESEIAKIVGTKTAREIVRVMKTRYKESVEIPIE